MSANPRIVIRDIWTGPATAFQPGTHFYRRGTILDVTPGSALEAYYGASNLAPLPPTGGTDDVDHSALGN